MKLAWAVMWLLSLLALAACGSGHDPEPGDAARGQQLFMSENLGGNGSGPSCLSCHSVTLGEPPSIGPNLSNVGARAASTVPGMPAEAYLRAAIVEPDTYLAEGYQEGIHPRDYGQILSASQINDLVAYLRTLHSGVN